jgi:hypothetical protein
MKITLAKIKKHNPCIDGWEQILEAKGPDMDREWELVEAFDSNDLDHVLWALRCLPEHSRLWRKYAVWCVMQVDHLLPDQRSMDALDIAWSHSICWATDAELAAARAEAKDAASAAAKDAASASASDAAWAAALASASDAARAAAEAAKYAAWAAAGAARNAARAAAEAAAIDARDAATAAWVSAKAAARAAQKDKLIEILSAGEWVQEDGR